MTYGEAFHCISHFQSKLRVIWHDCYEQATKEIGGNWQDPDVMRRRRERADRLADERMKDTEIRVHWGPAKKESVHG